MHAVPNFSRNIYFYNKYLVTSMHSFRLISNFIIIIIIAVYTCFIQYT